MELMLNRCAEFAPISWLTFLIICMIIQRKDGELKLKKRWVFGGLLINNISSTFMFYIALALLGYEVANQETGNAYLFLRLLWPSISAYIICKLFWRFNGVFLRERKPKS